MKIRPRPRTLAVAAVAGAVVLVGCSAAPPPPAAPEAPATSASPAASYRNEQSGFALTPPPGWQQVPGLAVSAATFVAPNRASGNPTLVNMNVVVIPTDADLDANLAGAKQLLPETFPDYKPVLDEAFTLADGQPAHLLGCTFSQSGMTLRNLQLLVVARGNAYVVSGTAPDLTFATYEPAIRQSLSTFKLI